MTVNTTNITSGPYIGNGASDTYSYNFRVQDKTQLAIYETDDLGAQTLLVVDTDYTVAGIGVDAGGIITRVAGNLPTDYIWYIRSDYEQTQLSALPSQGPFFPDIHEDALDKLTFLVQQILDLDDRSFRLSESIDIDGAFTIIANAAARAGLFLAFNASGDLTVSSGTGADAGLRTDLVSIDAGLGFHLISYEILSGELGVSSSEYPWGDIRRYDTLDNAIASCAALNIPLFQYGVNTASASVTLSSPVVADNFDSELSNSVADTDPAFIISAINALFTGGKLSCSATSSLIDLRASGASFIAMILDNNATGVASGRGVFIDTANIDDTVIALSRIVAEKYAILSDDIHSGKNLLVIGNITETDANSGFNFNHPFETFSGVVCMGNVGERSASASPSSGIMLAFAGTYEGLAIGNIVRNSDDEALHTEDGHRDLIMLGNIATGCLNRGINSLATGQEGNIGEPVLWVANMLRAAAANTSEGILLPSDATNGQIDGTIVLGNCAADFQEGISYADGHFIIDANVVKNVTDAIKVGLYGRAHGANIAVDCTNLLAGDRKTWSPKIIANVAPTSISSAPVNTGSGPVLNGFAFPLTINHTGSGLETHNLFTLPAPGMMLGQITVQFGNAGNNLGYSARIKWDGTTLTILDEVSSQRGTIAAGATLIDNSGSLAIQINTATAINDTEAYMNFDGVHYMRQT